jgi:hypothetical protein
MSKNWQKTIDELQSFITNTPSIQIDRHVMVIPDDVRPEFYRLFDAVRTCYVTGCFEAMLEEAAILGTEYAGAQAAVQAQLNLKSLETNPRLGLFLKDPIAGLIQALYDPLFDLIRTKINTQEFEEIANSRVENASREFFQTGYRHWVTLSLILLMKADKANSVPLPDQFQEPDLNDAETIPGLNVHEMPAIVDAGGLQMDISQYTPFISPNIVIRSGELDAFAGIRDGYNNVYRRARAISKKVEWLKMDGIRAKYGTTLLWPDLGIYLQGMKERLRILVEYYYTARPDVIADVVAYEGWDEDKALKLIKRHIEILKPRGGGFIISRKPPIKIPTETFSLPVADLREKQNPATQTDGSDANSGDARQAQVLVVGYDTSKLEPVIKALKALEITPADEYDDLEEVYHI